MKITFAALASVAAANSQFPQVQEIMDMFAGSTNDKVLTKEE